MVKHFKLIAFLMVSALLLISSVEISHAGEKVYNWKFFGAYGPTEGPSSYVWKDLFKRIEKETNGRMKIKIFWYGQHPFEGSDMLKVISDGSAEMAHYYGPFLSSVEPVFGIDALPMLFPTDPEDSMKVGAALWGGFSQDRSGVLERILEDRWGATLVHMIVGSQQRFFTKGYKVDSMNALKGHKVRANSPEVAALVELLGGTPAPLKWGEIYTALQQGLVDGIHTSTFFAKAAGFSEHIDTISMIDFSCAADGLMINLEKLNELPEDIRNTMLKILREDALKPQIAEVTMAARAFEELAAEGKKIYAPGAQLREEISKACLEKITKPWIKRVGPDAQEAFDMIQKVSSQLKK